jgi:YHS domain-containing protein
MKMIHYSLIATCVAVFAAVETPDKAMASDQLDLRSAIPVIGSNEPLLAQADVGSKKPGAKGPKVNVDQNGVILRGYDPVAYFKQNKPVKGNPKYSSSYGGATYYFASRGDKAAFDKAPANYAPHYGGFCAHGMTKRKLNDSDPVLTRSRVEMVRSSVENAPTWRGIAPCSSSACPSTLLAEEGKGI